MAHRAHVANQRLFHHQECMREKDNPNVMLCVQDGYDTFKATAPLYGLARPDLRSVEGVKTKISATILFGRQCVFLATPPWVRTGGNLAVTSFMSSLSVRINALPAGAELPQVCKLLFDGGPENWCETFFCFGAYLVATKRFSDVYIQRLPAHHAYNGMDAKFAPASTYFYGTRDNRSTGKNAHTIDDFFAGLRKAYEGHGNRSFLGGVPVLLPVHCTFDFNKFIAPFMDEEFGGWGHSIMNWQDENGHLVKGKRGSSIHYLHFFLDTEGTVRMRYKTAATYPPESWLPQGASGELPDGKKPIGATPFKVPAADIPAGAPPTFADFKLWDEDGEIRKSTLTLRARAGDEFMPLQAHQWWENWWANVPESPAQVHAAHKPVWPSVNRAHAAAQQVRTC